MRYIILILVVLIKLGCAGDNYYYRNNQKINMTSYDSISRNSFGIDYYKNDNGILLGVNDKLIVKLQDAESLEMYIDEFDLVLEKTIGKNLYLLKTENKSLTIDISNRLNEKEDVKYAHPDFITKRIKR